MLSQSIRGRHLLHVNSNLLVNRPYLLLWKCHYHTRSRDITILPIVRVRWKYVCPPPFGRGMTVIPRRLLLYDGETQLLRFRDHDTYYPIIVTTFDFIWGELFKSVKSTHAGYIVQSGTNQGSYKNDTADIHVNCS